jgi:hypothetical protein
VKTLITKHKTKVILSMLLFFLSYFFAVLTFQTYTIPRYILPLSPLFLLGTSWSLTTIRKLTKINTILVLAPIIFIIGVSLFSSTDPVSTKIWGKEKIFGENIYTLRDALAGNDGITYNMQYALILKKRTNDILNNDKANVTISNDCHWLFPDPRNDIITMKILNLDINPGNPCTNFK